LSEVLVPLPDRKRSVSSYQRHKLVGDSFHANRGGDTSDGHGHDDSRRTSSSRDIARRAGCGACRQTIIDDHDRLVLESDGGNTLSIPTNSLLEGGALFGDYALKLRVRHAEPLRRGGLDVQHSVLAYRSHRQFGLQRNADFANDQHIQATPQNSSDFVGHGYATSWKADDHDVLIAQHFGQSRPQLTSRVSSVNERFHLSRPLPIAGGVIETVATSFMVQQSSPLRSISL
jgi:hypothetical protein